MQHPAQAGQPACKPVACRRCFDTSLVQVPSPANRTLPLSRRRSPARRRRNTRAISRSSSLASSACSCLRWRVGASGSNSVTMATAVLRGRGEAVPQKVYAECSLSVNPQACRQLASDRRARHPAQRAPSALAPTRTCPQPNPHLRHGPQTRGRLPLRPGAAACRPTRHRCWPAEPGARSQAPRPPGIPAKPPCARNCGQNAGSWLTIGR